MAEQVRFAAGFISFVSCRPTQWRLFCLWRN